MNQYPAVFCFTLHVDVCSEKLRLVHSSLGWWISCSFCLCYLVCSKKRIKPPQKKENKKKNFKTNNLVHLFKITAWFKNVSGKRQKFRVSGNPQSPKPQTETVKETENLHSPISPGYDSMVIPLAEFLCDIDRNCHSLTKHFVSIFSASSIAKINSLLHKTDDSDAGCN